MIIDDIVNKTKERLIQSKKEKPLNVLKEEVLKLKITNDYPFYKAISKKDLSYILEVKKASPSKGIIQSDFNYINIAKEYEDIGADAISVLTEPDFFKGDIKYLNEISQNVKLPLLRKDFIIDEYMIYEAKLNNASAVLLIASILDEETLKRFIKLTYDLGMDALVEARDKDQVIKAINAKAKIIGVNNRDLRDFSVDINHSIKFREMIPNDILFISESGIYERSQTLALEKHNVNGVLIGETLMKSSHKKETLMLLKGKL